MATHINTPVLDTTWVQVVDSAFLLNSDNQRQLRLSWKAATSKLAPLVASLSANQTLDTVRSILAGAFTTVDDADMRINWALPEGYAWLLQQVEVKQLEAGEYSILTTTFATVQIEVEPGEGYVNESENSWSLQWQTYSVSPYRYCNEEEHDDNVVDQNGQTIVSQGSQMYRCSVRRHIEQAFTQNAKDSTSNQYRWENSNITYDLTKAEKLIMNKVAAGVNPTFHYPVLTHTRVVTTNLSSLPSGYGPDVADGIDIKVSKPAANSAINAALEPWDQLEGQWLYCGQTVTSSQRTIEVELGRNETVYTYTFQDVYEGGLQIDDNFYGSNFDPSQPDGRWRFGEGPQVNPNPD